MRWALLMVMLLAQWESPRLFGQAIGLDQPGINNLHDSVPIPAVVTGSTEGFYGSPHLLVNQLDGNNSIRTIPLNRNREDWKFFFLLAGISALAIARYFYASRIGLYLKAATGNVSFNQMDREVGFFNETVTYLLFFNFLLVFSLLVWQTIGYSQWTPTHYFLSPFLLFVTLLMAVVLFFILKSLLLKFVAWVFGANQPTSAYLKNIFLYNQLIGLALIVPVAYLVYNPSLSGLLVIWSIWVILNLLKILRGAIIGYNVSAFSGYYLILYLCTIELAPVLLIVKFGSKYFLTA